jgi:hypothetical protein
MTDELRKLQEQHRRLEANRDGAVQESNKPVETLAVAQEDHRLYKRLLTHAHRESAYVQS